jgi:hypothetical protein
MKNGPFRAIIINYRYVTSENGIIGATIYFNPVNPNSTTNTVNDNGLIRNKRDYVFTEDLNNLQNIGVGIGSEILVYVKTEHPYIQYGLILKKYGVGKYNPNIKLIMAPKVCPLCGEKLAIIRDAKKICCQNEKCKRYDITKLARFVRFCLRVNNVSYKVMYFLYTTNKIKSIIDIYTYLQRNMLKPSDVLDNPYLDQILAASRMVNTVELAVLLYSLLPQLTPTQAWRYASTDIKNWTKPPTRLFMYNGEEVRPDRSDALITALKLHKDYLKSNASEIELLNNKLSVSHSVNHNVHKKTFYLLPSKSFSKEYFSDRVRLYGGKVDTLRRDIRSENEMKNVDIVIGKYLLTEAECLVAKNVRVETYYWLRTQLNASII